jgi:hypothetical protein
MNGDSRHVRVLDGKVERRGASLDRDPPVRVPLGPFEDGESARCLERAFEDEVSDLPRIVGRLVGRDGEYLVYRLRPRDRIVSSGVEVHGDDLSPVESVVSFELHDVDPRSVDGDREGNGVRGAHHRRLEDFLVHDVGGVAGDSVGEVAGPQDRVPLPQQEARGDGGASNEIVEIVVRSRHENLPLDRPGPLDVSRHFQAQDERREGDHAAGRRRRLIVDAGDGRFDDVGPRREGGLDRGVQDDSGRAGLIGLVEFVDLRRSGEGRRLREPAVGRIEKSLALSRSPTVGKLGHPPLHRAAGHPASVVVRHELDLEFPVEGRAVGRVEQHFESGDPVGLHQKAGAGESL